MALAAERHTEQFDKAYVMLRKRMSTSERATSDQLLQGMRATFGDTVAATRAEVRYHDGMRMLRDKGIGANYCMQGMLDMADLAGSSIGPEQAGRCPQTDVLAEQIDKKAADVFEDWHGYVTVEPLQPVQVSHGHAAAIKTRQTVCSQLVPPDVGVASA